MSNTNKKKDTSLNKKNKEINNEKGLILKVIDKFKNNKKLLYIAIAIIILILILVICLFNNSNSEKLKVDYQDGQTIKYDDFSKKFKDTKTITVKNITKHSVKYNISWYNVTNTIKKQNNFLYEISCAGDDCKTLGTSQIPVAAAPVLQDITIKGNSTQKFTVKLTYKGKEKNVKFTGELLAKISESKKD